MAAGNLLRLFFRQVLWAIVHHPDQIADRLRHAEVLLDQQNRSAAPFHLFQAVDQRPNDRGREPLGRLVDEQQLALFDERAGE